MKNIKVAILFIVVNKTDLMQTSDLINRAETIVKSNQQRFNGFNFNSE